jgi:hypothetical protein
MNLTIDRKKWLRGTNKTSYSYEPLLLNNNDKMCCLGFYARACGLKKKDILDVTEPCDVDQGKEKLSLLLNRRENNNQVCNQLIHINDNLKTSDTIKEKAIKNNFSKIGVKVKFVG